MSESSNKGQGGRLVLAVHAFPRNQDSARLTRPQRAPPFAQGGLPPWVIRRLREHIDSNIDQHISVGAMAKLANLSACYFVRAFKQSVGVTPHYFLMRRRVERAIELLSGTEMPLSEIAVALGFTDQSHCARRFRRHVGMSPRDYRRSTPRREMEFDYPSACGDKRQFVPAKHVARDSRGSIE